MGNLTVRNLDDRVIEGLKAEAKANERSLEGEVRHGMCCNFQEAAGERLVESTGLRLMQPPRTAC